MNQPPSVQPARHKNITQCVQSMKQECIPSIGTGRYGWPLWLARGRPETSPSPLNGAESTSTSAEMCVITRSLSVFWRSKSSIVVAALFVTVFTAAVCVAFSVFVGITLIFVIVKLLLPSVPSSSCITVVRSFRIVRRRSRLRPRRCGICDAVYLPLFVLFVGQPFIFQRFQKFSQIFFHRFFFFYTRLSEQSFQAGGSGPNFHILKFSTKYFTRSRFLSSF